MMLRDINQQQEYAIYVLNDRLSNVETEGKSFFCVGFVFRLTHFDTCDSKKTFSRWMTRSMIELWNNKQ